MLFLQHRGINVKRISKNKTSLIFTFEIIIIINLINNALKINK